MELAKLMEFAKCFSSESRLRLIKLLANQELCVCELEEVTGQTQPSISQHLRILFNAGLVEKRRDGQWIYYRLNHSQFEKQLHNLESWVRAPLDTLEDFQGEMEKLQNLDKCEQVQKCKGNC